MARKPRIHFPGALYHVIARGNQRQDIFVDDKDRAAYLSYLSEYKARCRIQLYAYACMKNHIHLLLEVKEMPLSRLMQTLLFRYTRYFNRRYGKIGHLFQGRYRAILCDKDAYLLELVRYIHLNPVRAEVAKDLRNCRWTSHLSYVGDVKDDLVDVGYILGYFDDRRAIARRKYLRFVNEGIDSGHQEKFYRVKDQRFLGEEDFVTRIERETRRDEPVVFDIGIEVIAREVSKVSGIPLERLYSVTRERQAAHGRGMIAYLARVLTGLKVKKIAQHFDRSPMTVSQAILEIERRMGKDESIKRIVDKLKQDLSKEAKRKYFITIA